MENTMNSQGTVIGAHTHVKGNLQGDEDLNVIGRVDGTISLTKTLIVEPTGVVVADVNVLKAVISGTVVGNITADEMVHITEEGRVVGDISSPRVVLVEGASFRGNVDMGDLDAPRASSGAPAPRAKAQSLTARPAAARPAEPARAPAPPRPAPPPKRVVPAEAKATRPAPAAERRPEPERKPEPERRPEPDPERRPEPPRRPEPSRRPESLERRAEAAAQAVVSRSAAAPRPSVPPRPRPEAVGANSGERTLSSAEPAAAEPPRPPTTAGKKVKARRR